MARQTVLLVDDSITILQMAGSVLPQASYKVATATNGADALPLAFQVQPDLILVDGVMPGRDGLETTRELRTVKTTEDTPILMLTSKDDPEFVKAAFQTGCSDYIVKPVDGSELLAMVKSMLEEY